MVARTTSIRRVGVVDDDPSHREFLTMQARLAGYEPTPLEAELPGIEDLVQVIRREQLHGALCDHRLQEGNYAGFFGAAAVAALYDLLIPAVLVTDYVGPDINTVIRQYRSRIPTLIRTSDLRPEGIREGFDACERELTQRQVPITRRTRRCFVVVDDIEEMHGGRGLTVHVPRWKEHEAIVLPEVLIPENIRTNIKKGSTLIASVNTEARQSEDLFFEDFEAVPDEDLTNESS